MQPVCKSIRMESRRDPRIDSPTPGLKKKRRACDFSPEHIGSCGWVTRASWNLSLPENQHQGLVAVQCVFVKHTGCCSYSLYISRFSAFPNRVAGQGMMSCESSAHTRAPYVLWVAMNGMWLGLVRDESACRWCAVDTRQMLLLS